MSILFVENNTDKIVCIYNSNLVPDDIYNTYKVEYDSYIPNMIYGKELHYDRSCGSLYYKDVHTLESELITLYNEYSNKIANLTIDIPSYEIQTWGKQEQEAREFVCNNLADTPLIDSICIARGIDKSTFCDKVLDKAMIYAQAVGTLIGERQIKEKNIKSFYTTE